MVHYLVHYMAHYKVHYEVHYMVHNIVHYSYWLHTHDPARLITSCSYVVSKCVVVSGAQ